MPPEFEETELALDGLFPGAGACLTGLGGVLGTVVSDLFRSPRLPLRLLRSLNGDCSVGVLVRRGRMGAAGGTSLESGGGGIWR